MSEQMQFLKNTIASAQEGRDGAVETLRTICSRAAENAPKADMIRLSQFLFRLGEEAAQIEQGRN